MKRQMGILLSIPALPSHYGIGDFGKEAREFIDTLYKNHVHLWQILPMNPMGYGHSPYQPYSSKAGEPLLISLDELKASGYIKDITPAVFKDNEIDYENVAVYKETYYQEAYQTLKTDEAKKEEFEAFRKAQPWVEAYGIFYAFKKHHGLKSWLEWEEKYRLWPQTKNQELLKAHAAEIEYAIFLQYLFYTQWQALKQYAHEKEVKILGDIPFYVGIDSLDVWMNQDDFLLDEKGYPTFIAGVPPDYFSPTGQRWGNPIYDWDKMKKDHYAFWIDRLAYISTMFDIIRIDHFRAFDTYWKIPSSCPTAVEGKWILGPAHDFFDTVKKELPDIEIVAEDLGDLRPEVLELRDDYQFPGMQVIQFHFNPDTDNRDVEDVQNLVVYTGTHDNQTLWSWYLELPFEKRRKSWNYLCDHGCHESTIDRKWIHYCLDTKADTVIFPVQDLLCLDDQARINTPGTVGDPNWKWRLMSFDDLKQVLQEIKEQIIISKRA